MIDGHRLRKLRKKNKTTQDKVAEYLGITRSAYSHFETNRNQPDNEKLVQIANYFNVTTDYLLGRTTNKSADFLTQEFTEIDSETTSEQIEKIIESNSESLPSEDDEEVRQAMIGALVAARQLSRIISQKRQ